MIHDAQSAQILQQEDNHMRLKIYILTIMPFSLRIYCAHLTSAEFEHSVFYEFLLASFIMLLALPIEPSLLH